MNCACEIVDGKVANACAAHHEWLRLVSVNTELLRKQLGKAPAQAIPDNDLLGTDVALPEDPTKMPKPVCTKCGGEIPFFYFYVYKLASTQGTMIFQASCCPHAGCRALFVVMPIGLEATGVAAPGKPGWPGMPDA